MLPFYKIFPGNPLAPAKRLTLDFREGVERRLRVIAIGKEKMELGLAKFGFRTTRERSRATDGTPCSFFSLFFFF